jgi:CBS domain-containing protein
MATVKDFMTTDVAAIDLDMSLREALEVLRGAGVSGAPVVRATAIVGVVSATDILEFAATTPGVPAGRPDQTEWGEYDAPDVWEEGSDSPSSFFVDFWSNAGAELTARLAARGSPEWDFLMERSVSDVVTRRIVSVPPECELREAAEVMAKADVHRLLVMEEDELVGILSAKDLVRAVAEGRV